MKYQTVLLIALVFAVVLMDSANAWLWDDICRWAVSKVCTVVGCSVTGPFGCLVSITACSWGSTQVCGKRRKRDLVKKTLGKDQHLIPLPALFESYDLNGDGKISVQELALTAGIDELETQKVAFPLCDKDGDGFLTRREFVSSPLVVEEIRDIELERREVASEVKSGTGRRTSTVTATEGPPPQSDDLEIPA